jgi:ribosomal-protein-serine acetyltransferase
MHKLLLDLPTRFETERLYLRCYQAGDGPWFYAMSQKNRAHLMQYESENVVMDIQSEEQAEIVVRDLAADWVARKNFFLGVFDKKSDEFVAQVYIGPVKWDLPEFEVGYFADVEHEGQGFVTEAVKGALRFIFTALQAHRIHLRCDDTNIRSWRVAERCGITKEGHCREDKKNPDGTFSGTFLYAMLRSEFEALGR